MHVPAAGMPDNHLMVAMAAQAAQAAAAAENSSKHTSVAD